MAIATLDQLLAAATDNVRMIRTASRTALAAIPFSTFGQAGSPGAGVLAGTDTAAGLVPTDATAGCPPIASFGGGATGYLTGVTFGSSVAGRLVLYDMVFKAGAYSFNSAVTLASQPSYSGRMPGGTNYNDTEIWLETVTAFTGNQSIAVTYTNQDGTTGRTTGTLALGFAPILGRMTQLSLQAGDVGVQKIESVTSSVSTVGTFNVLVLRRLWGGRVKINNDGDQADFLKTGMPQVFDTSALIVVVIPDSTATGIPEVIAQIKNA